MQKKATHDAGVWKLPDGEAYYRDSVLTWTTSTKSPAEIHQIGLDIIKDHSAQIDAIMRQQGMTKGTVGERLRAMYDDPKLAYANTDAAKEQLIADLNVKVAAIRARLPDYFGALPKADVKIQRVPKYLEAAQAGGYYNAPSLDGKIPGIYWINLRDTAEQPRWLLPTLTYHESIPGHHLQLSIQREAKMPLIRKLSYFSSYIEGWALYAEQLADEMGMYKDDPLGRIGFLHDAMFRAVRLVVDSGMHAMKWTREDAIKFFVDTLGDKEIGDHHRDRALCRFARPSLRLHAGQAHLPGGTPEGARCARRQIRHQELPRRHAGRRRGAAGDDRRHDGSLHRVASFFGKLWVKELSSPKLRKKASNLCAHWA